ncbi:MAG TPA: hypothetical protein VNB06_17845 [Thermoanaerobaculia bacterium]|nr:hypothetical protein [Thermoanaerobaculia bacterium]
MPAANDALPPWLRRLAFWSAASALAAVVPVPFLDEHLVRVTRRSMVRELARERGLVLRESEVVWLAGVRRRFDWGCAIALVVALTVKTAFLLVRRLFRSIFFWLAIKDASNTASFTFHEGFLLRQALADLEAGASMPSEAPQTTPRAEVLRLRAVVERVVAEVDPRPLRQAFRGALRGSTWLLRATARRLKRLLLGVREEEAAARTLEDMVPSTLVERLGRALLAQSAYLEYLTRRMVQALAEPAEAPPPPPATSAPVTAGANQQNEASEQPEQDEERR